MSNAKIGRPTKERVALIRNQTSSFLMNGYLETTVDRAKEVQKLAEKILTLAINTNEDVVKVKKTRIGANDAKETVEVLNDGTVNQVYGMNDTIAHKDVNEFVQEWINSMKKENRINLKAQYNGMKNND